MIIYPYHYLYKKAQVPIGALATNASPVPKPRHVLRVLPPALITVGSILIANVLWPLISYQLFSSPELTKPTLNSPVPVEQLGSLPPHDPATPQVMGASIDYTDPTTWFPQANYNDQDVRPTSYSLAIPAVNIKDATVYVGGHDLGQGLVQYPGTGEPGKYGTTVIFGHSVLRQFYNPLPTNPRRYLSIFSKIMTLKTGDRIYLDYNGARLTYEVKDKTVVQPEDLDVLAQRLDTKELKLITCVPEGTYLHRGVVTAQLMDISKPATTNVINETGL